MVDVGLSDGFTLTGRLVSVLGDDDYLLSYSVTFADGETGEDAFRFRVGDDGHGTPLFRVIFAVALGAAALAMLAARRRFSRAVSLSRLREARA